MLHKKLTILYLLFSLSTFTVYSQNCDCNIFPVKKECKQECGLKDLQRGSEEELVKKLGVKKETAQRIVKIQSRKNYKKLSDFEEDLPVKYYQDLEKQFNVYLESSVIQNNQNGDNVNGNKVMGNLFSGNPFITINNPNIDSIKYEIEFKRKNIRVELGYYYIKGCELRDKCRVDSNYVVLDYTSNIWYREVLDYLQKNLDYSYVAQFSKPKIGLPIDYNVIKENENLFVGMNHRVSILYDFITTLR